MRGVVHTATVVSKLQSKATGGGDEVWGGDTDIGYMNALVDSCAKVKDPLSNALLDLTRQCVNVSLSRDGLTEVRPPSLPFPSAHAQALPPGIISLRCCWKLEIPSCP